MKKASIEAVVRALNDAGARYLIAGGLAVIAHGYLRLTRDIDLVIDLERENLLKGLRALGGLGYAPKTPVTFEQFADPRNRGEWARAKNMVVFQLWSDAHREAPIDVFIELPFPFDDAYAAAKREELAPGLTAPVVSYAALVWMKERAGRARDMLDLDQLRKARGEDRGA